MDNMNCFECVYKHIAAALSYGKQIIGGFNSDSVQNLDSELNHQIDFLGQLVNAEHHLQLINQTFYMELRTFRKQCQNNKFNLSQDDLDIIRRFYKKLTDFQNKTNSFRQDNIIEKIKETEIIYAQEKFSLVFPEVTNKEYFDFSYNMLRKNLTNEIQVIVQKTSLDLSGYDIKIDQNFLENLQDQYFLYIKQNMAFIHQFDLRHFINGYENINGIKDYNLQPQMIKKSQYNYQGMNQYFSKIEQEKQIQTRCWVVNLEKEVCCKNKQRIKFFPVVVFHNDTAFQSLKLYF